MVKKRSIRKRSILKRSIRKRSRQRSRRRSKRRSITRSRRRTRSTRSRRRTRRRTRRRRSITRSRRRTRAKQYGGSDRKQVRRRRAIRGVAGGVGVGLGLAGAQLLAPQSVKTAATIAAATTGGLIGVLSPVIGKKLSNSISNSYAYTAYDRTKVIRKNFKNISKFGISTFKEFENQVIEEVPFIRGDKAIFVRDTQKEFDRFRIPDHMIQNIKECKKGGEISVFLFTKILPSNDYEIPSDPETQSLTLLKSRNQDILQLFDETDETDDAQMEDNPLFLEQTVDTGISKEDKKKIAGKKSTTVDEKVKQIISDMGKISQTGISIPDIDGQSVDLLHSSGKEKKHISRSVTSIELFKSTLTAYELLIQQTKKSDGTDIKEPLKAVLSMNIFKSENETIGKIINTVLESMSEKHLIGGTPMHRKLIEFEGKIEDYKKDLDLYNILDQCTTIQYEKMTESFAELKEKAKEITNTYEAILKDTKKDASNSRYRYAKIGLGIIVAISIIVALFMAIGPGVGVLIAESGSFIPNMSSSSSPSKFSGLLQLIAMVSIHKGLIRAGRINTNTTGETLTGPLGIAQGLGGGGLKIMKAIGTLYEYFVNFVLGKNLGDIKKIDPKKAEQIREKITALPNTFKKFKKESLKYNNISNLLLLQTGVYCDSFYEVEGFTKQLQDLARKELLSNYSLDQSVLIDETFISLNSVHSLFLQPFLKNINLPDIITKKNKKINEIWSKMTIKTPIKELILDFFNIYELIAQSWNEIKLLMILLEKLHAIYKDCSDDLDPEKNKQIILNYYNSVLGTIIKCMSVLNPFENTESATDQGDHKGGGDTPSQRVYTDEEREAVTKIQALQRGRQDRLLIKSREYILKDIDGVPIFVSKLVRDIMIYIFENIQNFEIDEVEESPEVKQIHILKDVYLQFDEKSFVEPESESESQSGPEPPESEPSQTFINLIDRVMGEKDSYKRMLEKIRKKYDEPTNTFLTNFTELWDKYKQYKIFLKKYEEALLEESVEKGRKEEVEIGTQIIQLEEKLTELWRNISTSSKMDSYKSDGARFSLGKNILQLRDIVQQSEIIKLRWLHLSTPRRNIEHLMYMLGYTHNHYSSTPGTDLNHNIVNSKLFGALLHMIFYVPYFNVGPGYSLLEKALLLQVKNRYRVSNDTGGLAIKHNKEELNQVKIEEEIDEIIPQLTLYNLKKGINRATFSRPLKGKEYDGNSFREKIKSSDINATEHKCKLFILGYAYWSGNSENKVTPYPDGIWKIGKFYLQLKIYEDTDKTYEIYLLHKYIPDEGKFRLFKIDKTHGRVDEGITDVFLETKPQIQQIHLHLNIITKLNDLLVFKLLNKYSNTKGLTGSEPKEDVSGDMFALTKDNGVDNMINFKSDDFPHQCDELSIYEKKCENGYMGQFIIGDDGLLLCNQKNGISKPEVKRQTSMFSVFDPTQYAYFDSTMKIPMIIKIFAFLEYKLQIKDFTDICSASKVIVATNEHEWMKDKSWYQIVDMIERENVKDPSNPNITWENVLLWFNKHFDKENPQTFLYDGNDLQNDYSIRFSKGKFLTEDGKDPLGMYKTIRTTKRSEIETYYLTGEGLAQDPEEEINKIAVRLSESESVTSYKIKSTDRSDPEEKKQLLIKLLINYNLELFDKEEGPKYIEELSKIPSEIILQKKEIDVKRDNTRQAMRNLCNIENIMIDSSVIETSRFIQKKMEKINRKIRDDSFEKEYLIFNGSRNNNDICEDYQSFKIMFYGSNDTKKNIDDTWRNISSSEEDIQVAPAGNPYTLSGLSLYVPFPPINYNPDNSVEIDITKRKRGIINQILEEKFSIDETTQAKSYFEPILKMIQNKSIAGEADPTGGGIEQSGGDTTYLVASRAYMLDKSGKLHGESGSDRKIKVIIDIKKNKNDNQIKVFEKGRSSSGLNYDVKGTRGPTDVENQNVKAFISNDIIILYLKYIPSFKGSTSTCLYFIEPDGQDGVPSNTQDTQFKNFQTDLSRFLINDPDFTNNPELSQNKYLEPKILKGWEDWEPEKIVTIMKDLKTNYRKASKGGERVEQAVIQGEDALLDTSTYTTDLQKQEIEKYESIQKDKRYLVAILNKDKEFIKQTGPMSLIELVELYASKQLTRGSLVYLEEKDKKYGIPIEDVIPDYIIEIMDESDMGKNELIVIINAVYDHIFNTGQLQSRIQEKISSGAIEFTEIKSIDKVSNLTAMDILKDIKYTFTGETTRALTPEEESDLSKTGGIKRTGKELLFYKYLMVDEDDSTVSIDTLRAELQVDVDDEDKIFLKSTKEYIKKALRYVPVNMDNLEIDPNKLGHIYLKDDDFLEHDSSSDTYTNTHVMQLYENNISSKRNRVHFNQLMHDILKRLKTNLFKMDMEYLSKSSLDLKQMKKNKEKISKIIETLLLNNEGKRIVLIYEELKILERLLTYYIESSQQNFDQDPVIEELLQYFELEIYNETHNLKSQIKVKDNFCLVNGFGFPLPDESRC